MRFDGNPRNYVYDERHKDDPLCPDGMVPKIPNMPSNADPDWVDWVASLRHDKPANLTEAVEQIYFNAICFGGDMGPNGNSYYGIDEGIVWTNDAINEDVELVRLVTKPVITGDTSDGYHTFNALYHHRAVLFSVIVRDHKDIAWKSKLHHDGSMYEGMFIVGIETPDGQATYHYDVDPYWDMFDCKELDRAPEWDGHTSDDAIARIATLGAGSCRADETDTWECVRDDMGGYGKTLTVHVMECTECGHTYEHVNGDYEFCPRCGRKRIDI